ncbi:hypothetical protein [Carnobacterium maltaromaticum]|uniref:hypothetical protein n=1 Tax=Carnobacterium maltaromaticum TaxID=2751 RepID=UPI00191B9731|nr:hypothetical protein [Carnobacterium maltaromaticum]CAD5903039.1 hypothetical protein CMALT394_600009 [Carnobacterium maltaromaticum]
MSESEKYFKVLVAFVGAAVVLYFYFKYVEKDKEYEKYMIVWGISSLASLLFALTLL